MEYRQLGKSGLKVPELCFGAGTFGGGNEFFNAWGATDNIGEARKIVDICMDAGINMFDTADIYSDGASETVLGKAINHLNREDVLISTKATFRLGKGPNDVGSSRYHLIQSAEPVPETPWDGLYRHLPPAWLRCDFTGGGDAASPRRPGARGQGAVYRVLKFFRMASDEVVECK